VLRGCALVVLTDAPRAVAAAEPGPAANSPLDGAVAAPHAVGPPQAGRVRHP
jgi:hypothetical protein